MSDEPFIVNWLARHVLGGTSVSNAPSLEGGGSIRSGIIVVQNYRRKMKTWSFGSTFNVEHRWFCGLHIN